MNINSINTVPVMKFVFPEKYIFAGCVRTWQVQPPLVLSEGVQQVVEVRLLVILNTIPQVPDEAGRGLISSSNVIDLQVGSEHLESLHQYFFLPSPAASPDVVIQLD